MSVPTGILRSIFGNPIVAFGTGVAVGFLGYKYRKEIVATVAKTTDMGKDFVLNQRESLADIIEEAKEAEENANGAEKA